MAWDGKLKLNIENYLGNEYASYLDKVNGFALSEPAKYFAYRNEVSNYIKSESIKGLYDTLYYALRNGLKRDNSTKISEKFEIPPSMSDQTINEKVIAISKTLNEFLDDIINDVCPVSANSIATHRTKKIGDVV